MSKDKHPLDQEINRLLEQERNYQREKDPKKKSPMTVIFSGVIALSVVIGLVIVVLQILN